MMKPLLLACLLSFGCSENPYFDDDEGAPQPDSPSVGDHPDHLSLPYVLGGKVHISAHRAGKDWRVRSDSPQVLSIDALTTDNGLTAECTAVGEGRARLSLLDGSGEEQRSATVSVVRPDRARLFAHGPARLLGLKPTTASTAEVNAAKILVGQPGVFAVAYYQGNQRLYGRGVASAAAPAGVTVENKTSSGLPTNDWLFVTPTVVGTYALDVRAAGSSLASLSAVGVVESEVAGVALSVEAGIQPRDHDNVWVLAQAADAAGQPIYGVYFDWTVDGVAQKGEGTKTQGDLYRFEYDPNGSPKQLVASRGAVSASLAPKMHQGLVRDTTYLGCSAAPGARPRGPWLLAALLVVPLIRRRARRS